MYAPINLHTHYSLLRGLSKPDEIVKAGVAMGLTSMGITDIDSLSGAVNFYKACKDAKVKPLLGTKVFVSDHYGYVTLVARNLAGWNELVQLSSDSHATVGSVLGVTFSRLEQVKNCIVVLGEPESVLTNAIVAKNIAYVNRNPEDYRQYFIKGTAEQDVNMYMSLYSRVFGENFFAGIFRLNNAVCPIDNMVADLIENSARESGVKQVALSFCFYAKPEQADDHRLLLCSHNKIQWNELADLTQNESHATSYRFAHADRSYLPSSAEMYTFYTKEQVENSNLVADMCESYSILSNPTLPDFPCPDGMSQADYLRHLCRVGWTRLKKKLDNSRLAEYTDRVKMELDTFSEVNLEGYFLIVQDIVNWVKSQGMLVGCSRGSAGGCLVSYLTGITTIDPIIYELYFERFYNKGRNTDGKVSFPDIDVDFPVLFREMVLNYIRHKYGVENVSQVVTFSRLQGRGALKEVLRIHAACDQTTANQISKNIPQEAEIADKLEEAKEKSIIRWTLMHDAEALKEWCTINEDGTLSGEFAQYFEQAIRIEGTYKSSGKHASALIISNKNISSICPMVRDKKTGAPLAGIEFEELESVGLVKFDILGLNTLDKLMGVNQLLRTGKLEVDELESEEQADD